MHSHEAVIISPSDTVELSKVDALLAGEGIRREKNLDCICGVYDFDGNLIATGSSFSNTLRCFAVSAEHKGEGLMARLVTRLLEYQASKGILHVFVHTKSQSSRFFEDLGFCEIARVDERVVFLENRRGGFESYLRSIEMASGASDQVGGAIGAVVMNANPFTKGHLYLVKKALEQCGRLYVFVVSEDRSDFPFSVRMSLVKKGLEGMKGVSVVETGPYMISSATFPSYFLKDEKSVIEVHASLDAAVFLKVAKRLHISKRFLGSEPFSATTSLYNQTLSSKLPKEGVECLVFPRVEKDGVVISASAVRRAIKDGRMDNLADLVPKSTLDFLLSGDGKQVMDRIKSQGA